MGRPALLAMMRQAGVQSAVKFPGTVSQTADSFAVAWVNPNNVMADDGTYSTNAGGSGGVDGSNNWNTYRLNMSNFGFSIPAGKTILGIKVEVEGKSVTAGAQISSASLTKVAATPTGTSQTSSTLLMAATDTVHSFGGPTTLWGTTWTVAEVNGSGFGVCVEPISRDGTPSRTLSIDYVKITVYYQ